MEPFKYAEDLEREMLEDFGYLNISKETIITKAPNLFGDETLFTEEMNHQPNMTRPFCSENTIQQEGQYTKLKNNQVESGISNSEERTPWNEQHFEKTNQEFGIRKKLLTDTTAASGIHSMHNDEKGEVRFNPHIYSENRENQHINPQHYENYNNLSSPRNWGQIREKLDNVQLNIETIKEQLK